MDGPKGAMNSYKSVQLAPFLFELGLADFKDVF